MIDVLALELVTDTADDDWFGVDRVRILVNGVPLRELAEAAGLEQDFCYPTAFLLRDGHLLPSPDRLGETTNPWRPVEQTALLADGCGDPGCDSLLARIRREDDQISWLDLTWYRRPGNLRSLGPFHFNHNAYTTEVNRVRHLASA